MCVTHCYELILACLTSHFYFFSCSNEMLHICLRWRSAALAWWKHQLRNLSSSELEKLPFSHQWWHRLPYARNSRLFFHGWRRKPLMYYGVCLVLAVVWRSLLLRVVTRRLIKRTIKHLFSFQYCPLFVLEAPKQCSSKELSPCVKRVTSILEINTHFPKE